MKPDSWWKSAFILCLLVAGFVAGSAYQQWESYTQLADKSDGSGTWQYWGDISNRWQAFIAAVVGIVTAGFTYMLYLVSLSQRNLLKQANETAAVAIAKAEQANEHTRQSIVTQIDGQRGRLVFLTTRARKQADQWHLLRNFKNIGNSAILVKEAYSDHQFFPLASHATKTTWPKAVHDFGNRSTPWSTLVLHADEESVGVLPDDGAEQRNILERTRILTPEEQRRVMEDGTDALFIQYKIVYETLFGDYARRCAWYLTKDYVYMVKEEEYNGDTPIP